MTNRKISTKKKNGSDENETSRDRGGIIRYKLKLL